MKKQMTMPSSYAARRVTLSIILVILIVAIVVGAFITTTNRGTNSSSTSTVTSAKSQTGSSSVSNVTLTSSPLNQDCSSNSSVENNLIWTEANNYESNHTMSLLVLAMNPSSTASLCVQYSRNPAAGVSEINVSATALTQLPNGWICCAPGISIAAQPSRLNFGNNSGQNFFVKFTVTATSNSSGYEVLGISGLCQFAGLVVRNMGWVN